LHKEFECVARAGLDRRDWRHHVQGPISCIDTHIADTAAIRAAGVASAPTAVNSVNVVCGRVGSAREATALWPVNHGGDLICLPHQGGAQFQLTSVCCGKWHARAASAWRVLGPGFVTGSSEDDPSGIQTVGPNSLPDTTLHPLALVAAAIFGFLVDFIKVPTFDRLGVV